MGIATTRIEERCLAVTGTQDYAKSEFEHHKSVLNAGVLLSIPALLSQGLRKAFTTYGPLPPGFYGLSHIILLSCFMALCRIKNPEQLKKHPPGELGKLLGLDRVPEVGHFRKKLKQVIDQNQADVFHLELFRSWVDHMPEMFFYIDGHVRVYHGKKANLSKRYVSREKLCLSGTTEFWINDQSGMPLMVITGELNEKLKEAIEQCIEKIKPEIKTQSDNKDVPLFTMVFDRESYEPLWFKKLWKEHKVAVITYRKDVSDKWDEDLFEHTDQQILNNNVKMQLCEMGVCLSGRWFREVRKLTESGHQTSILTTHPTLEMGKIAVKMFSRWTQENFFKYMVENFDFDRMIEYGTEPSRYKKDIPNPVYRKLTYQLKKVREKMHRLESKVYNKLDGNESETIEEMKNKISKSTDLIERINTYKEDIIRLLEKRIKVPSRITLSEMPEDHRYNKLKLESKKFKNAILMIAYRAETSLYNLLTDFYKGTKKDGRVLLKKIFSSDADMIPDHKNKTLTIVLHGLATPRDNEAVRKLCQLLNETQTFYPSSNLKLIFKTIAT